MSREFRLSQEQIDRIDHFIKSMHDFTTTLRDRLAANPGLRRASDKMAMRTVANQERARAQRSLAAKVLQVRNRLGLPNHPYEPFMMAWDEEAPCEWCDCVKAAHSS